MVTERKSYGFLSHQRTLITGFRDPIKADPSVYLDASYKLRGILMLRNQGALSEPPSTSDTL